MRKILIVDDEPNIALLLEYIFKKEKFEVYIARDGTEALGIVENEIQDILGLKLSADKYISKPFSVKKLVKEVKQLLLEVALHKYIISCNEEIS